MASSLQEVGTRWRKGCRRRSSLISTRSVQSGLGAGERCSSLRHPSSLSSFPGPCPGPVMTLRPSLLPLRLLLLLLSGAVCWAEAEPETESPVRTLQVETLVRRQSRSPAHPALQEYSLREYKSLNEPGSGEKRKCGN